MVMEFGHGSLKLDECWVVCANQSPCNALYSYFNAYGTTLLKKIKKIPPPQLDNFWPEASHQICQTVPDEGARKDELAAGA